MKRYRQLVLAAAACLGVLGVAGRARAEALINPKAVSWGADRLDVFAVGGSSGALYHKAWNSSRWWPAENGPWEALGGGGIVGTPTVVSWGANRLDIFVVGSDHALYHKAWDGANWYPSQTDFENLGGYIIGNPTVVSWGANRLDIFVLSSDHALYHKAWNGSGWSPSASGWEWLGGYILGDPAVTSWGPGRLDIFVVGPDHALYHKAWAPNQAIVSPNSVYPSTVGGWVPSATGYDRLGGVILGSPTVASWGPGRLDIFVIGTDHALYHKAWDQTYWYPSVGGYQWLGGYIIGDPTVVSWGANRLDIFVRGSDRALYHKAWDGANWYPAVTGWEWLGGVIGPPTTVSWGANRLDTFAAGDDGAIYHKAWDGAAWYTSTGGYERLGDASPPAAAAPVPQTIHYRVDVTTPDWAPIGGWVDLVVNANGDYTYSGHIHDSGFPNIKYALGTVVMTQSAIGFGFAHQGSVDGTSTLFGRNRDNDWTNTGNNPDIAAHWEEITQGGLSWKLQAQDTLSAGVEGLLEDIAKDAVKAIAKAAVEALIKVVVA